MTQRERLAAWYGEFSDDLQAWTADLTITREHAVILAMECELLGRELLCIAPELWEHFIVVQNFCRKMARGAMQ